MGPEGTHFGSEPAGEGEPSKSGGEAGDLQQKTQQCHDRDENESYYGNQSLLKDCDYL